MNEPARGDNFVRTGPALYICSNHRQRISGDGHLYYRIKFTVYIYIYRFRSWCVYIYLRVYMCVCMLTTLRVKSKQDQVLRRKPFTPTLWTFSSTHFSAEWGTVFRG